MNPGTPPGGFPKFPEKFVDSRVADMARERDKAREDRDQAQADLDSALARERKLEEVIATHVRTIEILTRDRDGFGEEVRRYARDMAALVSSSGKKIEEAQAEAARWEARVRLLERRSTGARLWLEGFREPTVDPETGEIVERIPVTPSAPCSRCGSDKHVAGPACPVAPMTPAEKGWSPPVVLPTPAEVHALAKGKGWWPELEERPGECGERGASWITEESVQAKITLIHSEISEAVEEIRDGHRDLRYEQDKFGQAKPEGAIVELADVVIRCWDLGSALDCGEDLTLPDPIKIPNTMTVDQILQALGSLHRTAARQPLSLRVLVGETQALACALGLDLAQAIAVKHAFNRTRKHRHGGRLA